MSELQVSGVGELLDEIRHGRMIVLVDDRDQERNAGVVMLAAEYCEPSHVTFLARRARGLVCLALTPERCDQLALPPMVEGSDAERVRFTLSIEAAHGIDTGISAADRAHTVQVAVAAEAAATDIVQPGHIFPLRADPGGVLVRAGQTEASVDYARLAGLTPAAVIADVLDDSGEIADGAGLAAFAQEHGLKVGAIADLIHYWLANERTIERVRDGLVDTDYGPFRLVTYRDSSHGGLHIAVARGDISAETPTLVRVHINSTPRDVLGTRLPGGSGWNVGRSLRHIAESDSGVLVLIGRHETDQHLLQGIDLALGNAEPIAHLPSETYNSVGLGSQILRDLGVGKIRLMGAPIKYNAISGFGLEVTEYLAVEDTQVDGSKSDD